MEMQGRECLVGVGRACLQDEAFTWLKLNTGLLPLLLHILTSLTSLTYDTTVRVVVLSEMSQ